MSTISDAKAIMDSIVAIAKRVKSKELDEEIRKLYGVIHSANDEALTEKERRLRVEERLKELETERNEIASLATIDAMLWKNERDGQKTGPFCSCCHTEFRKLYLLKVVSPGEVWECPKCKNTFESAEYIRQVSNQAKNPEAY